MLKIVLISIILFSLPSYAQNTTEKNNSNQLFEYRLQKSENKYLAIEKENNELISKLKYLEDSVEHLKKQYTQQVSKAKTDNVEQSEVYKDMLQNTNNLYDKQLTTFNFVLGAVGLLLGLVVFFGFREIKNKIDEKIKEHILDKGNKVIAEVEEKVTLLNSKTKELDDRLRLTLEKDSSMQTENDKKILDYLAKKLAGKKDKTSDDWFLLGLEYQNDDKYDKALEAYSKVDETSANAFLAYHNVGLIYSQKGEYDKAIESYNKANKIKPNDDKVLYNLGVIYSREGDYDKAIEYYTNSLDINPEYSSPYTNLLELSFFEDIALNHDIEDNYIKKFSKKKESFIKYEMINILKAIKNNDEYEASLKSWHEKYVSTPLVNWSFKEFDVWIQTITDSKKQKTLIDVVENFKSHKPKID